MKQLYIRDEFSKNVQEWNKLRAECVERALTRCVIPDLQTEIKLVLLAEAKEFVLRACCRKLYNWIKVAPYQVEFPEEDEDEWDTSKGMNNLFIYLLYASLVSSLQLCLVRFLCSVNHIGL